MAEGVSQGRRPELVGGGLIRSAGGWAAGKALRKVGGYQKGDERILGSGEFVEETLARAEESLERRYRLRARGYDFERVVKRVGEVTGMDPAGVLSPGKYKRLQAGRSLLCFWAVRELGVRQEELAGRLRISQAAVSMAVRRGEKFVTDRNLRLIID
jgi:putative transposase